MSDAIKRAKVVSKERVESLLHATSGPEWSFVFRLPTELRFGAGRLEETAELARGLGKRVLLVTSRHAMERLGYTEQLATALMSQGIEVVIYKDVHLNPTTGDVDQGAACARSHGAEFVIALGGGSALDCAKAIAAVAPGSHAAADYVYQRVQPGTNTLPLIAIPTTAGTGSEMNRSCMITDPSWPYKSGIRSNHLFPRYAVVDPLLTYSAGLELTAQTGFDALAHAVESYVSPKAQPICDALALQAIQDVAEFLPVALTNPHNSRAREKLALASTTMGINLTLVGTCVPHRLDKPLCALHPEISHGQSVALFYPCWARWSYQGNVERFARVTEIIEPATRDLPLEQRAAAFAEVIAAFLARIGLAQGMSAYGVEESELSILAQNIEGDLSINPVPFACERLSEFLAEVFSWVPSAPTRHRRLQS